MIVLYQYMYTCTHVHMYRHTKKPVQSSPIMYEFFHHFNHFNHFKSPWILTPKPTKFLFFLERNGTRTLQGLCRRVDWHLLPFRRGTVAQKGEARPAGQISDGEIEHQTLYISLASGKVTNSYGKSPSFSWVNQLFLWQFSSSQTANVYQRVEDSTNHSDTCHLFQNLLQNLYSKLPTNMEQVTSLSLSLRAFWRISCLFEGLLWMDFCD